MPGDQGREAASFSCWLVADTKLVSDPRQDASKDDGHPRECQRRRRRVCGRQPAGYARVADAGRRHRLHGNRHRRLQPVNHRLLPEFQR